MKRQIRILCKLMTKYPILISYVDMYYEEIPVYNSLAGDGKILYMLENFFNKPTYSTSLAYMDACIRVTNSIAKFIRMGSRSISKKAKTFNLTISPIEVRPILYSNLMLWIKDFSEIHGRNYNKKSMSKHLNNQYDHWVLDSISELSVSDNQIK